MAFDIQHKKNVSFDVITRLPINYVHNYMVHNNVLGDKHGHLQITTFSKLTVQRNRVGTVRPCPIKSSFLGFWDLHFWERINETLCCGQDTKSFKSKSFQISFDSIFLFGYTLLIVPNVVDVHIENR